MLTEKDVRSILFHIAKSDDVWSWPLDFDFMKEALDSLDQATLALSLDEKHHIRVPDPRIQELRTIKAVLAFAQEQEAS